MTTYLFGDFEFNTVHGQLRKNGDLRALRSKSAQLLAELIQNRSGIMTRETIAARLWTNSPVCHDNNIEACIRDIRKALGDSAADPAFIKTHPRRGYQFIGNVEIAPAVRNATRSRWLIRATAIVAVFVLAAGMVHIARFDRAGVPVSATTASKEEVATQPLIAILPSSRITNAPDDYQFAVIHDAFTGELAKYAPQLLRVLSTESSHRLMQETPIQTGRLKALGVSHVLWVLHDEETSSASAIELVDLSDDGAILAKQVESDDSIKLLALDIARVMADARGMELPGAMTVSDNSRRGALGLSLQTRQAYYLGRHYYFQGDFKKANASYERGIEINPNNSLLLSAYAYSLMHQRDDRHAETLARRALALNAANPEALIVLGNLSTTNGDLAQAQIYFDSAKEIAPGLAQLHHGIAALHVLHDDFNLALAEIKLAESMDPLSAPVLGDSAWFYLLAGKFEESLIRCQQLNDILGTHRRVLHCRYNAYFEAGELEQAVKLLPELMLFQGASADDVAMLNFQKPAAAIESYWRWRLSALGDSVDWGADTYAIAGEAYARLGRTEDAVRAFEHALREGSRAAPYRLRLKSLNSIRSNIKTGSPP